MGTPKKAKARCPLHRCGEQQGTLLLLHPLQAVEAERETVASLQAKVESVASALATAEREGAREEARASSSDARREARLLVQYTRMSI